MGIINSLSGMTLLTFIVSFVIAAAMGPVFIPWLHKLKFGQEIREEGPSWHQKKSGTPTMGGIIFILPVMIAMVVFAAISMIQGSFQEEAQKGLLISVISLGFGVIGFVDDYIKVVKKRNLGLTSSQKFFMQILLSVVYVAAMWLLGDMNTSVIIPFTNIVWNMPVWLYTVFIIFVMAGVVNAVNLTDGLDGLAASVTVVVGLFFVLISTIVLIRGNLLHVPASGVSAYAGALAGGLLGFLIYNKYPARVFMGDTGSLFLGASVALMGITMEMTIFLVFIGFIYMVETLSVIMQVTSFKLTGKRIFKMSPIHHHFEMCGWSEKKIVAVFTVITVVMCAIAYLALLPALR